MTRRAALGTVSLLLTLGAVSGCSQVAVLQPVAGDGVTAVNNATSDVLAREGVDVMTWPVCSFDAEIYTCRGETLDGQPIVGTTSATEPLELTVTVGDRTVYQGPVQAVLDEAGRVP